MIYIYILYNQNIVVSANTYFLCAFEVVMPNAPHKALYLAETLLSDAFGNPLVSFMILLHSLLHVTSILPLE